MKKNLRITLVFTYIAAIMIPACTTLQPAKASLPPLRFEYTQWWGDYTLLVAKEKGFFDKYNVDVEPVYYDIFSDTYPDLAAGQIDGGLIAIGDTININRSSPMKVVAVHDDGGQDAIVARPEIVSIENLRGGTVGIQTGSQYELIITEMLKSAGMSIGDVNVASIYPEDGLAALESNQVQAVYIWEPYLSEALAKGYKIIYPEERVNLFPDLIVFRKSIVDQRPDDVRAFLKAWFEAVDYRMKNPQEARSIAAKYLGISVDEVQPDDNLKILTLEDNKAIFDIQSEKSIYATTKITFDYLVSIGTVSQALDPLELIDPSYLP